ncbi:MAG: hypothetical protein V2I37_07695 [Marinilabiliaceae bacterium]|jgi:hypothetical protein|nr:hypothetical protein [Marinilabiliaceae bacterium]
MRLLKFAFFLICLQANAQDKPPTIKIDVSKNDELNLSYFADKLTPVSLRNPKGLTLYYIDNVIKTQDYLYIKGSYKELPNTPRFLKYTLDGKFVKEIGLKDEQTGEFFDLKYVLPDFENEELRLKYARQFAIYEFDGSFVSESEFSKRDVILSPIFNKHFWTLSLFIDIEKDIKNHFLIKYDIDGSNPDTLYTAIGELNDIERGYKKFGSPLPSMEQPTQWAIINDKLSVSMALEDAIFEVDKYDKVKIAYKFELLDIPEENINRIVFPFRIILKNYILYGYNISHKRYYYVYDIRNGTGFNTMLRKNQSGKPISGIYDDIQNTGFIYLRGGFNSELFFTKETKELKARNISVPRKSNITLFIIEPKE